MAPSNRYFRNGTLGQVRVPHEEVGLGHGGDGVLSLVPWPPAAVRIWPLSRSFGARTAAASACGQTPAGVLQMLCARFCVECVPHAQVVCVTWRNGVVWALTGESPSPQLKLDMEQLLYGHEEIGELFGNVVMACPSMSSA